eukprot:TRINITY_DN7915_c0_g4_i2.p1 TRINITY_DN7915_c0_g4~~TRINITY_DN7915_c0_g4_i2.p1  ORF type:complete len:197 (+),score=57.46 TRINITY_DN7915_c0_g4_i2:468-1058(+)
MQDWITHLAANRGTKGGSAKCPLGIFKSRVKDAVVPLCEEHFPDDKAKNDWLVLFYNSKGDSDIKELGNRLAVDLGNDPPDMSKSLKKPKKKRDRLTDLAEKYELKSQLKLPAKGPFGMDALAKVGAVCCDCSDDAAAFCASSLKIGEEDVKPPQVFWASKGVRKLVKGVEFTGERLAQTTLSQLGFVGSEAKTEL